MVGGVCLQCLQAASEGWLVEFGFTTHDDRRVRESFLHLMLTKMKEKKKRGRVDG